MKKRDNDFVDVIVALADEHFARNDGVDALYAAIAEKLASARHAASITLDPFNGGECRWAIRRVLLAPNIWSGVEPRQRDMRRTGLERLLALCKGD